MILFLILIISEILTIYTFRHHFQGVSKTRFYLSLLTNSVLSIYLWIFYAEISFYKGEPDNPDHVWLSMSFAGAVMAIVIPRIILDILHFTERAVNKRRHTHLRSLTNAGILIWIAIFLIVVLSSTRGRYNIKTDIPEVKIAGLPSELEGLTIVHISDLHLSTFYRNPEMLARAMEDINSHNPDIIINSGDFVTFSHNEFGRNDTILSVAKSRLGNFAVLGNHDIGTYHPGYDKEDIDSNMAIMSRLISESGYTVLNDEHVIIRKGEATVGIAGIITKGRYPEMVHGDLDRAINGMDSVDISLLISHDPDSWREMVAGKAEIDITFAGHTHGMQMGIYTKRFKWSPAKYFYPEWGGLYNEGNQYLSVNRGLGLLSIPVRIWMPPEITVLRLTSVQ